MKKFFTIFFVVLGVIFLLLVVVLLFMYMVQSLGSKPMVIPAGSPTPLREQAAPAGGEDVVEDKNPMLSPTQEKALETFGIDPASVPSEITPEQEACFVEALGRERVDEIIAGDAPSPIDFFKAKGCVE
jgi:hypothetical protein